MPLYRAELLAKKPLRYAALIHDVSQVLYLPSDWDDGSYARDRSGHGNHGTIYGAARVGGKIGMALSFDGVDDYVDCGKDASLRPNRFTLMAWVKTTHSIVWGSVAGYHYTALWPSFALSVGAGAGDEGKATAQVYTDASYYVAGPRVDDGLWHHLVAVYDGSYIKIYVNGDLKAQTSATGDITYDKTKPFKINGLGGYHYLDAVIDEVRIYNRALSQDEIRMLMYRRLI